MRYVEDTNSSNIRMIDPRFNDKWTDAVNDNYCVVVLRSDSLNKSITTMPRGEVFPTHTKRQNLGTMCTSRLTDLSPALPSTVIYPSPESEAMKTMAAFFFLATLPARDKLKSFRK
jgi:hypothetical protein